MLLLLTAVDTAGQSTLPSQSTGQPFPSLRERFACGFSWTKDRGSKRLVSCYVFYSKRLVLSTQIRRTHKSGGLLQNFPKHRRRGATDEGGSILSELCLEKLSRLCVRSASRPLAPLLALRKNAHLPKPASRCDTSISIFLSIF